MLWKVHDKQFTIEAKDIEQKNVYYPHRVRFVQERWVWTGILTGGRGHSLKDSESMNLKNKTNIVV